MAETDNEASRPTHISGRDGTQLATYRWRAADGSSDTPVLCLHGLERTAREFSELAKLIANGPGNNTDVFAFDWRGRGDSGWSTNSGTYGLQIDADDLIDIVTALGIEHAHIVASGFGGAAALSLARTRPGIVKSITLNDSGPALDGEAIARLQFRLKRAETYKSWSDLVAALKTAEAKRYPDWTDSDWLFYAKTTHHEAQGSVRPSLHEAFIKYLLNLNLDAQLGTLWNDFSGLARIPMQIIRGELSTGLSNATFEEMLEARKMAPAPTRSCVAFAEGNGPLLHRPDLFKALQAFISCTK